MQKEPKMTHQLKDSILTEYNDYLDEVSLGRGQLEYGKGFSTLNRIG